MRFGRAKAGRKTLAYFRRTIGLEAPYHVLLHFDLVRDMLCVAHIDNIVERLQKVLQEHRLHIHVLSSTLDQLHHTIQQCQSSLNKEQDHLVGQKKTKKRKRIQKRIEEWTQQLHRHEQALEWMQQHCQVISHEGFVMPDTKENDEQQQEQDDAPQASPTTKKRPRSDRSAHSTTDPIYSFLTRNKKDDDHNPTPYIVAAQDPLLLDGLRQLGTVPIVRWADQHVLLLEQPPRASQRVAHKQEVAKYKAPVLEEGAQALVNLLLREQQAKKRRIMASSSSTMRRLKTTMPAKGPNPLSCKPKQKKGAEAASSSNTTTKKKRTRTRIRPSKGANDHDGGAD